MKLRYLHLVRFGTALLSLLVAGRPAAAVTVAELGGALDAPNWEWRASNEGAWAVSTSKHHEGVSCVESTQGTNSLIWLETTLAGTGWLTCWTSGTGAGIQIVTNGQPALLTPAFDAWTLSRLWLEDGSNVVRWSFPQRSATDTGGQAWLDAVTFTPGPVEPIVISQQPPEAWGYVGLAVSLEVSCVGTPPFRYQWQKDGVPLAGETNAVLRLAIPQAGDEGIYAVQVSNRLGGVLSSNAPLHLTLVPDVPNGPVNTIQVLPDGQVIVGGRFSSFTTDSGASAATNLVRLDTRGHRDPSFQPRGGELPTEIQAIQRHLDGRILISGTGYQARLDESGAYDPAFSDALNGLRVGALLEDDLVLAWSRFSPWRPFWQVRDGRVAAGFGFDKAYGLYAASAVYRDGRIVLPSDTNVLSRWLTASGRWDPSFQAPAISASSVRVIALQDDGRILLGGSFTNVGGQASVGIARLLPDGAVDPSFQARAGVSGGLAVVSAISIQADGRLLLGGNFSACDGHRAGNFVRLLPDGAYDSSLDTSVGANASVNTIAVLPNGDAYLGGAFSTYDRKPSRFLARIAASSEPLGQRVGFRLTRVRARSSEGKALVAVQRIGDAHGEVRVDYQTRPGSAHADEDFTPTRGTLIFRDGQRTDELIVVPILSPRGGRALEASFEVLLSNVQAPAELLPEAAVAEVIVGYPWGLRADWFASSERFRFITLEDWVDGSFGAALRTNATSIVTSLNLDGTSFGSPIRGFPSDYWTVFLSGWLTPPVTDDYRFVSKSDDGIQVRIDGALIIDNWSGHSTATNWSRSVHLEAGKRYPVRIQFYNGCCEYRFQLGWATSGVTNQVIPSQYLSADLNPEEVVLLARSPLVRRFGVSADGSAGSAGTNALFALVANHTEYTYQWRKDGLLLQDGAQLQGTRTLRLQGWDRLPEPRGLYGLSVLLGTNTVVEYQFQVQPFDALELVALGVDSQGTPERTDYRRLVATRDRLYALRGGSEPQLEILQVSENGKLTLLGSHPAKGTELAIQGATGFLVSTSALDVVDVTDPTQVVNLATVPLEGGQPGLAVRGERVLAFSGRNQTWWDMANPAKPMLLASNTLDGVVLAAALVEDGALLQLRPPVYELSVDLRLRAMAYDGAMGWTSLWSNSGFFSRAAQIQLSGRLAAVVSRGDYTIGALELFDVSSISSPNRVGSVATSATRIALAPGLAAVAALPDHLDVYDITDPTVPSLRASTICTNIQDLAFAGDLLCVAVRTNILVFRLGPARLAVTTPTRAVVSPVGAALSLPIEAEGAAPLRYAWRKDGRDLVESAHFQGVASSRLVVSPLMSEDAGSYELVLTDANASTTRWTGTVEVSPGAQVVLTVEPDGRALRLVTSGVAQVPVVLEKTDALDELSAWTEIERRESISPGEAFLISPAGPAEFYRLRIQ